VFALRCVEMMIVVIVLFGEKENSAKTKYSLRWPLAEWASYPTNTRHPRHGDNSTHLLTRCPNMTSRDGVTPSCGGCSRNDELGVFDRNRIPSRPGLMTLGIYN